MTNRISYQTRGQFWAVTAVGFFILIVFILNFSASIGYEQDIRLAGSFLHGRLSFTELTYDSAVFNGQYYWPLGPLPAVVLLPFAAVTQGLTLKFLFVILHISVTLACGYLVYRIARQLAFSSEDAIWLMVAFCGGSAFFGVAANSIFFGHAMTVLFLLLAINEYLKQRQRPWLIGCYVAGALATRLLAGLGAALFFGLAILTSPQSFRGRRQLWQLLGPLVAVGVILAWYNYARFGNPLQTGYALQQLFYPSLIAARAYGLFSLVHLPGNLYYFFLALPRPVFRDALSHVLKAPYLEPDPWGMSIFLTSPYLLYLCRGTKRDRQTLLLWATIILTALPIFLYYGLGWLQFGYRYALDFFPFLFLLFLQTLRQHANSLSRPMKVLLTANLILNSYFVLALFL